MKKFKRLFIADVDWLDFENQDIFSEKFCLRKKNKTYLYTFFSQYYWSKLFFKNLCSPREKKKLKM